MTHDEAQALLDEHVSSLKTLLNIQDWEIQVELLSSPDEPAGYVTVKYPYRSAGVTLNLHAIDTPEVFYRVLRHELIHVMLGSFYHYTHAVSDIVERKMGNHAHAALFDYAQERMVLAVERLLDFHPSHGDRLA